MHVVQNQIDKTGALDHYPAHDSHFKPCKLTPVPVAWNYRQQNSCNQACANCTFAVHKAEDAPLRNVELRQYFL